MGAWTISILDTLNEVRLSGKRIPSWGAFSVVASLWVLGCALRKFAPLPKWLAAHSVGFPSFTFRTFMPPLNCGNCGVCFVAF